MGGPPELFKAGLSNKIKPGCRKHKAQDNAEPLIREWHVAPAKLIRSCSASEQHCAWCMTICLGAEICSAAPSVCQTGAHCLHGVLLTAASISC